MVSTFKFKFQIDNQNYFFRKVKLIILLLVFSDSMSKIKFCKITTYFEIS